MTRFACCAPDFFTSVLWKRLVGQKVLAVQAPADDQLRFFASCAKEGGGSVVLVFSNFGNSSKHVSVSALAGVLAAEAPAMRQEYHLTTGAIDPTDLNSRNVRLNGQLLTIDSALDGQRVDAAADLVLVGRSYGFVVVGGGGGVCL